MLPRPGRIACICSYSLSFAPATTLIPNRPPVTSSAVATIFATTGGGYSSGCTDATIPSRSVTAPSAVMIVKHSRLEFQKSVAPP